jgi:hypothetical protein
MDFEMACLADDYCDCRLQADYKFLFSEEASFGRRGGSMMRIPAVF